MLDPCNIPAAKEDYEDYDLSTQEVPARRTFDEAVKAINRDFKNIIRIERENKGDTTVWSWYKVKDGKRVELPIHMCRILLFLYSRRFKMNLSSRKDRRSIVICMLNNIAQRRIILQVIECNGDKNLTCEKDYQDHYERTCLTIHRYFQRVGANGFVSDMSKLTYYLRTQKSGSGFLQAPCVATSYSLQASGVKSAPPPDASRVIRHYLNDDQLLKYVHDLGGDSLAIFEMLEAKFFSSNRKKSPYVEVNCCHLGVPGARDTLAAMQKQGPGLVSKFEVPEIFECSPPSDELKTNFPCLASYTNWSDIPAGLIPPGVARFTAWNEPAEFIPLLAPSDADLDKKEKDLKAKWKCLLNQWTDDDGTMSTSVTVAASTSEDSLDGSQGTRMERTAISNVPSFVVDDDDVGEDWSHYFDGVNLSIPSALNNDSEPGKGDAESEFHAMISIGHYEVDGVEYWLLQNSWVGPMQLVEVSTDYLLESGAHIYFYHTNQRSPKPEEQWVIKSCSAPVAESSRLERSDRESWPESLEFSVPQNIKACNFDDIDLDSF